MACIIDYGYSLGCRDNVGGIQKAFIGNFDANVTYTEDVDGTIIAYSGATVSYYTFEQENETGEYLESASISNENGTVFFEQTCTLTFHKVDAALKNQVKLLAQGNLSLLLLDQRGTYHLVGKQNGVRVTEVAGGVGKAYGDLNGYTITFLAKEPQPASQVDQDVAQFDIVANP
jgi:hypothetical protein